jgi:hypothetical protein
MSFTLANSRITLTFLIEFFEKGHCNQEQNLVDIELMLLKAYAS